MQMEENAILQSLNSSAQNPNDFNLAVNGLVATIPDGMSSEQKQAVENWLKQVGSANQNRNFDQFWNLYNKEKQDIITAVNRGAFDRYTPMQIRISIENALKKLNSISVIGCEGYAKMKKIAGRKV